MRIPNIFHRPGNNGPNARARRPRAGCCRELETLESRTPLSSGLGAAVDAPVMLLFSKIEVFIADRPVAVELASLQSDGDEIAIPAPSAAIVAIDAPPSISLDPLLASTNTIVELLANAPNGDAVSPLNQTPGSAGIALAESMQASPNPDAAAAVPVFPAYPLLSSAGTINDDRAVAPEIVEHYLDDGDIPPDGQLFGAFVTMGPAPQRGASTTNNNNDEEPDMSFSGTLESIDEVDGLSTWMNATQGTGRANWHALSFIVTDPSLQVDSSGEVTSASVPSYLATGGSSALDFAPTAAAVDDVLGWEESSSEPILPASITAGGLSLNILLGGLDVPIRTEPGGNEQVAELVPLPETSLALTATLWTVASETATPGPQSDVPSSKATNAGESSTAPSPWALFVTGTDQAIEQTCRDIRDGILADRGREPGIESDSGGQIDPVDWQGPILPAGRVGARSNESGSRRPDQTYPVDAARERAVRDEGIREPGSDDASDVALGAVPTLSLVSITTVIAGWFWRKRRRGNKVTGRDAE